MGDREMLEVAVEEARSGLGEGGIPIGAALFTADGKLLGRGRNRRVQEQDPSLHGETDAFRRSGRRRSYRDTVMVTTLARAGIAAGSCASSGSPGWWSVSRSTSPAGSIGFANAASRSWIWPRGNA
jgi:tRNA(Arg) A34 adenosine deaminase TadA